LVAYLQGLEKSVWGNGVRHERAFHPPRFLSRAFDRGTGMPVPYNELTAPYSILFTLHQDCIKSFSGLSPNVPPKTSHNEHIEAFPLPIGIAKLKVSIAKIIITIIKIIIGDSNFFHHDGKNYHPDSNYFYHDRKNYHRNLYLKGRHNYISCQDIRDKCRDVRVQGFNTWPRYGDV
jgi:hypothetical protein